MLDGNNPVMSDGSVKSMSVSKINNVPYVFVDFDKEMLHNADGSSYVAKVINDDKKKGNYIFSCDNGKCYYSSMTEKDAISQVKSDEKDISIGETIVIERVSPNPATVAKMVVTSFEPEPQPEPAPQPDPVKEVKAVLYVNANYTGSSLSVEGDIPQLITHNNFNDVVSSLKVTPGWTAQVYEDEHYKGYHLDFKGGENVPDLKGRNFDNRASSIKFIKDN